MVGYNPEKEVQLTHKEYILAGAINGAISRACVQPLDVLKIRFQLQVEPISHKASSSKYQGVLQAVRNIVKEEGVAALWKGHVPAQFLSVGYGIVQFSFFEYLTKETWQHIPDYYTREWKPVTHAACGGVAACASTIVIHPVDMLRTRLIAQGEPKMYKSMRDAAKSIIQKEGMFSLYKGVRPALLGVAPQMFLQFGIYTALQQTWDVLFSVNAKQSEIFKNLICGSWSGLLSKLAIYPLDLVKKRLQVQGFEEARKPFGEVRNYNGLVHCFTTLVREERFFGLYKGLWPSLLKAASVSGLSFVVYEQACVFLSLRHR